VVSVLSANWGWLCPISAPAPSPSSSRRRGQHGALGAGPGGDAPRGRSPFPIDSGGYHRTRRGVNQDLRRRGEGSLTYSPGCSGRGEWHPGTSDSAVGRRLAASRIRGRCLVGFSRGPCAVRSFPQGALRVRAVRGGVGRRSRVDAGLRARSWGGATGREGWLIALCEIVQAITGGDTST
jgi:hypothetical protein